MALVPKFVSVMIIFIFIFFVASNIEAKRYTCIQDSDCSVLFCSKSGKSYKAGYTTKSSYDLLVNTRRDGSFEPLREKVFAKVWKLNIPFRIKVFGCRCFWNRLVTKDNLIRRGVSIVSNSFCVHCCTEDESLIHLFFKCFVAKQVWGVIANWCEMKILNNDYGWKNLLFWCGLFKGEKVKKWNESIMWMAVCWGLWRSRNEILFEEGILCVLDLVWNIKLALK
ncbi:uncharacterized protein LOC131628372 isoform X2 [Vicia villosa]|uniref:uncharacterized protein LOC131628372 isoform X2 n=1 Tax=Vicia villosa TaxID=3911 RepID=UPI00273C4249|nr:uncharacterized protein LOC131628372 isoform X2 [Vicia villosa]